MKCWRVSGRPAPFCGRHSRAAVPRLSRTFSRMPRLPPGVCSARRRSGARREPAFPFPGGRAPAKSLLKNAPKRRARRNGMCACQSSYTRNWILSRPQICFSTNSYPAAASFFAAALFPLLTLAQRFSWASAMALRAAALSLRRLRIFSGLAGVSAGVGLTDTARMLRAWRSLAISSSIALNMWSITLLFVSFFSDDGARLDPYLRDWKPHGKSALCPKAGSRGPNLKYDLKLRITGRPSEARAGAATRRRDRAQGRPVMIPKKVLSPDRYSRPPGNGAKVTPALRPPTRFVSFLHPAIAATLPLVSILSGGKNDVP